MGKINCFFSQHLLIEKHLWMALVKHVLSQKKRQEKEKGRVEKNLKIEKDESPSTSYNLLRDDGSMSVIN